MAFQNLKLQLMHQVYTCRVTASACSLLASENVAVAHRPKNGTADAQIRFQPLLPLRMCVNAPDCGWLIVVAQKLAHLQGPRRLHCKVILKSSLVHVN